MINSEDIAFLYETSDGHLVTSDGIIAIAGDESTLEVETAEDEIMTETVDDEAGIDRHSMTVESDELELKSLLDSWNVSPLYQKLTACGINYENMQYLESRDLEIILGKDTHLLGFMITFRHLLRQWSTDSASKKPDPLKKNSPSFDVLNILNNSDEGRTFVTNYKKQLLDDPLRHKLVSIILKEAFKKVEAISRFWLNEIAKQICQIFPKEKKHVYYQKLKNRQPTGILYSKYANMRHDLLNRASSDVIDVIDESETVQDIQSHPIEIESDQCLTDNVEDSIKFIKDYTTDCDRDSLIEHWKNTFAYRKEKFNEYDDVDEVFLDWPPLKRETGHALLCMDFVVEYGVQVSNGLQKWNAFFEKNLATITGIIKDSITRNNLKRLDSTISVEARNKTIIMALHHLLVPTASFVDGSRWKPSVPMSQKSFLNVVNGKNVMLSEMVKRDKFCKDNEMKIHPVIYEITTCMGTRYNVCIRDVYYTVESLLEGVDVAYKIYKLLKIEFPRECIKVWKFIEFFFTVITMKKKCQESYYQS